MHAVDVDDARGERHELVLRRWARTDQPPDPGVVENEAAALTLVASVPELRAPCPRRRRSDGVDGRCARGRDDAAAGSRRARAFRHRHVRRRLGGDVASDTRGRGRGRERSPTTARGDSTASGIPRRGPAGPRSGVRVFEIARAPFAGAFRRPVSPRFSSRQCVVAPRVRVAASSTGRMRAAGPPRPMSHTAALNLAVLFGPEIADAFGVATDGSTTSRGSTSSTSSAGARSDAWRWHDAGRMDITTETLTTAFDDFLRGPRSLTGCRSACRGRARRTPAPTASGVGPGATGRRCA